jgi:two-component system phosphate regulon sensor histidine kinase PhoR
VQVSPVAGGVEIAVRDEGIGMTRSQARRAFDEFYRAHETILRDVGGAGLGLALCRRIVRAHGGRIRVESEPGAGSTFTVFLPMRGEHRSEGRP